MTYRILFRLYIIKIRHNRLFLRRGSKQVHEVHTEAAYLLIANKIAM